MNPILRHTLATRAARKVSGYVASPLRAIASRVRPGAVKP